MSSSTQPQAWETAVDPRLMKRLSPSRSRVIDPNLSQRLYTRSQFLSDRVSLFHQFRDRYLNAAEWQTDSLPIVYAQPVVSDQPDGSAQVRSSRTQSNRDRTAASAPTASAPAASAPIVIQAKFASAQATPKNPSYSDAPASSPLPIVSGTAGATVQSGSSTVPVQAAPHSTVIRQTMIPHTLEADAQPNLVRIDPVQTALERSPTLIDARPQADPTATANPSAIEPRSQSQGTALLPFVQREVAPSLAVKTRESPLLQVHPIRAHPSAIAEPPLQPDPIQGQPITVKEPALLPQVHPIQASFIQTLEAPNLPLQTAAQTAATDPSFVFVQSPVQPPAPVEPSISLNSVETASRSEQRSYFHTETTHAQETRPPHSTASPPPDVQPPPALNIDALVDTVERKLMRRLIIEQERRG